MEGWIKDYRKELESDVWIMPPLYHRVWQYLKYSANHANKEIPMRDGTKLLICKGQHLTSYRGISKAIGYFEGRVWKEPNPKTIKAICEWLEKNSMIHQDHGRGNSQYTLITLENWDLYQGDDVEGVTLRGQGRTHLVDINKNDKECKRNIYTAEFEIFYKEYPRTEDKRRTYNNWKTCLKSFTAEQLMQACFNYKRAKAGTDKQYLKSSANFLGKEKPFEDYIEYSTENTNETSSYRNLSDYKPGE